MINCTSEKPPVFRKGIKSSLAKGLLQLTIALCTLQLSAQEFRPFSADYRALYTTSPDAGPASALGFNSVEVIDGDSVFHPVMTFDPTDYDGLIEPDFDNCNIGFWATTGMCHPVNVPLWLGAEIRKTDAAAYRYTTSTGEHLDFDFALAPGDSALVYENEELSLYLIGEGEGSGSFLGIEDALSQFRLAVIDTDGGTAESPLHDAPVTLGAQLGAVNFMRIDSFPQVMQPVTIAGHTSAEVGLYAVKAADVYDFQEGDVFQYYHTGNYDDPFISEAYYETRTVTSREDTESEINYTFNVHQFKIDESLDSNFTASQSVSKSEHLAEIPLEAQEPESPDLPSLAEDYKFQSLQFNANSCGDGYKFNSYGSYYHSCPAQDGNCYGNPQNLAPGDWIMVPSRHEYLQGFGEVYNFRGWEIVSGIDGSDSTELVYALKNGEACGEQVVLGTTDHLAGRQLLKLYPNPASGHFRIEMPEGTERLQTVELHDIQGRVVRKWPAAQTPYATSGLPPGMYVVRAGAREGVFTQKLVIE